MQSYKLENQYIHELMSKLLGRTLSKKEHNNDLQAVKGRGVVWISSKRLRVEVAG